MKKEFAVLCITVIEMFVGSGTKENKAGGV
jgi:hypothetical protein